MKSRRTQAAALILGCAAGMSVSRVAPGQVASHAATTASASSTPLPAWTADARWYYVNIPRYRNGDQTNDPEGVIPWTASWPPLEADDAAPRLQTGEFIPPKGRRYGGDLRGLIDDLSRLKQLGVNALLISPVFHGAGEFKIAQVDLRHVDDFVGVKGGFGQADKEGSKPDSWIWTSSDQLMRELIHSAHESGIRVVMSGIFYSVMMANSPPSEMEAYYIAATRRWMDPDGDGNPLDGVDGWFLSLEEGPIRQFDEKMRAFWDRWRSAVRSINPKAVVISSGTLALSQLSGGVFDIALHTSAAAPMAELFGVQKDRKTNAGAFFDSIAASDAIAPPATVFSNINMVSGGDLPRLLTAVAAAEPLRQGRVRSPGPVPDDQARMRWKVATIVQHLLPGAPVTWYGDEVGMFGGPGEFAGAPMWWNEGVPASARSGHYQPEFFALIQWLHQLRDSYPVLRHGDIRRVLNDDANKIFAFARHKGDEEVVLVVNYGDTKQLVMLPAGQPGQLVGVRSPHLKPPRDLRKKDAEKSTMPGPLSVAGARQFVSPEGKVRIWLDPVSVRLVFVEKAR